MEPALIIAAIAGGALMKALEPLWRYNKTAHGTNIYTISAALNVLHYFRYWEHARELSGAPITSVYRSPAVNKAVGGVDNSDHVKGLACDFAPANGKLWSTAKALKQATESGALGNVRQFIVESYKNCIHLGYFEPGKSGKTEYLEQYAAGQHRPLSFEGKS
jgi:hypothetical protein